MAKPKAVMIQVSDKPSVHLDKAEADAGDVLVWIGGPGKFEIGFPHANDPTTGGGHYESHGGCCAALVDPTAKAGSYKYSLEIGGKTLDPDIIVW